MGRERERERQGEGKEAMNAGENSFKSTTRGKCTLNCLEGVLLLKSLSPSLASSAHRQLSMLTFYSLASFYSNPHPAPVTPNWPAVRNACTFIRIANNFKQKLPGTRPSSSLPPLPLREAATAKLRQPQGDPILRHLSRMAPSPIIIIGIIIVACPGWGQGQRRLSHS